jgi:geranylgeranyl reductase family protein
MLGADVVVVGGGPAGSAAAITAARHGRSVVVVDKASFPRDKCCGDGLTTPALRLLEDLGLRADVVPSWQVVNDVVVRSPSGRTAACELPRGEGVFAAVARRADLDAALLDRARAMGAKVLDGHACVGARELDDRVVLDVDGVGPIHARYCIAADGVWSAVRKHLGLGSPGYLGEWHAFRQYFCDVGPRADQDLFVWFEPDLLPGYAWAFPLGGGRANVGIAIQRGGKVKRVQDMARLWPDLLARSHVRDVLGPRARPEAPHKAWPIPARVDDVTLVGARTMFVGDAAASADPLTGEGIAQALETGILAAHAVQAGGPFDASTAAGWYEREVRRALLADHRVSTVLSRALRHRKVARAAVRSAGVTPGTRRVFARWLFEDEPRGVLLTPRRWHRRFLQRPGAFTELRGPRSAVAALE